MCLPTRSFGFWYHRCQWLADRTAYEDQVTESGRFDYYVQCAISAAGAGAGDLSDALSLDVALISSLTISSGQDGEVTSPGEGTFNYDEPTEILVCAESSDPALYEFTGWIGTAVTAGNVDDPSSACTTVLVDGHHTLIANFGSLQHDLLVYSSAGGSVTRPGEGTFSYLDSTEVDIKAVAQDDSYSFAGWSGTAVAAGKVVDSNALETSLFVDGDYSLCANFVGIEQCFLDVGFVGDGAAGGGAFLMSVVKLRFGPGQPTIIGLSVGLPRVKLRSRMLTLQIPRLCWLVMAL